MTEAQADRIIDLLMIITMSTTGSMISLLVALLIGWGKHND